MQPQPLSYSKYSTYRQCPRKYQLQYITKTYKDDSDNPAFVNGKRIHKALENCLIALNSRKPLPEVCSISRNGLAILNRLHSSFPVVIPEKQIAVDRYWKESSWFDNKTAYYRAVFDVTAYNDKLCTIIDWKTGKVTEYDDDGGQMHLAATIMFKLSPNIETIKTAFMFLEHKHTMSITFHRSQLTELVDYFEKLHTNVNADNTFDPKKNRYCFFCRATSEQCPYKKD